MSPPGCTQLCMKQFQAWTWCTIVAIAFGEACRHTVFDVFGALSRHKPSVHEPPTRVLTEPQLYTWRTPVHTQCYREDLYTCIFVPSSTCKPVCASKVGQCFLVLGQHHKCRSKGPILPRPHQTCMTSLCSSIQHSFLSKEA